MFTTALFTIAKTWKQQHKHASANDWIKKKCVCVCVCVCVYTYVYISVYTHTME